MAIGASAGGLEPLENFFRHMPVDSGNAFIVVTHLAPDHPTALPEILARLTSMPVEQVRNNTAPAPNRVYIIPPNATLTIEEGVLHVSLPVKARGFRTPIDNLFDSLAEDRGERAVCIILSGTGTDGTLGLRSIKEHGGMAMAQTLESAKYDAILRSAISTGLVDHILPVEAMPAKIVEYAAHLRSVNGKALRNPSASEHLGKIYGLIQRRAGHDFRQYKESTIIRRMDRRMKALQIAELEQYVECLEREPQEVDLLLKDLLIGVTQFFRDPEAFHSLERDVIPKLFDGKEEGGAVRVCTVGCATGEEAYSIGMLLLEHASRLPNPPAVKVFATDIDERGLEMARKGRYPAGVAEHIGAERLERFFTKEEGVCQVKRALREICIFSNHSFIRDPPFSRLDLISCRNVMIYLGAELQRKVFPLFHYALRSDGYLFLGPSESTGSQRELFRTVDKKHRIFQRKDTVPRPPISFPVTDVTRSRVGGVNSPGSDEQNIPKQIERIILQRYRPACVTVRENGDAVYFSGPTGRYLEQPSGAPELNVVNMAPEGLRVPLRTALHRAVNTRERAVQKHIPMPANGGSGYVDIAVEPVLELANVNLFMVVFEDSTVEREPVDGPAPAPAAGSEEIIRHLEADLRAAQEHAQAMYEELESSNEELRSANEEYQSTNEELETSKEELQSFNEELETVNAELNRKLAELDHSNSDFQNLLNGTQIATIFLSADLRIKNFTPAAGEVFRLIGGDIGRPITDLAAQLTGVDLMTDTAEVLRTLVPRERQLVGAAGRHFQMRVLPYRTIHNVIDGVVLTFIDVTALKEAEEFAQGIVDTVREPLLVLDKNLRVVSASRAFYETFKVNKAERLVGLSDLGSGEWDIPELRRDLLDVLPENKTVDDFQVKQDFPGLGSRTMLLNARRLARRGGQEPLILLAMEDITDRVRMEEVQSRLAAIVASSEDAIIGSDLNGVIQSWNQAAERLFGYRAAEAVGQPVSILALTRNSDEIPNILLRLLRGERVPNFESERRGKDGQVIAVSLSEAPILDGSGAVIGMSKIARDISETKRVQDALRKLNSDLQHFAYAASHDLQEPLRMVTSYTQLLARQYKGKLGTDADTFIAFAVQGAERMRDLLGDLREYWSVNEQNLVTPHPVECEQILAKALELLAVAARESGGLVTHDPLPAVMAEETPLLMLFQNLIGNALKYHRPGEAPRVSVSAERTGAFCVFSVSDSGIGIEPGDLTKIFAPFKRLHGPEYPGSGIGLAICHRVVERYGGRIWAESEYGRGSTFRFTLPAREE